MPQRATTRHATDRALGAALLVSLLALPQSTAAQSTAAQSTEIQTAGTQERGAPQHWTPPAHTIDWPGLTSSAADAEAVRELDRGPQLETGRDARFALAEYRRIDTALSALQPQRPGVVDAYVLVVAFDSDPVFGREAREAARVLERRYDAAGRTILLAGTDGTGPSEHPFGSPANLSLALARIAERMDPAEDVLILYTTSHGADFGLAYHDGDEGFGVLTPRRMRTLFDELGIRNRLLLLSACYSGVFVPILSGPSTMIVTAAAADRSSFGCVAENDWTFFGDALINHALRRPVPLRTAVFQARRQILQWENAARLQPSGPTVSSGAEVDRWLLPLEQRMPREESQPVGRPATQALNE